MRSYIFKPVWSPVVEVKIVMHEVHLLLRLTSCLKLWLQRMKERNDLQNLDDRLLRDIGKSKDEAQKEADRFFWEGKFDRHNSRF